MVRIGIGRDERSPDYYLDKPTVGGIIITEVTVGIFNHIKTVIEAYDEVQDLLDKLYEDARKEQ